MHTKRIIPCLDVNNNRVVKGTNFVNLRDAGDPVEVAKAYNKAGADELVFLDKQLWTWLERLLSRFLFLLQLVEE